jgi:hypothetical protein
MMPPIAATAATPGTLVSGTVTDGSRPLSGALVTLTAWPDVDYLNTLATGDTVPTRVVASGTTTFLGAYSLAPDLSSLPSMYVEPDGTVNMDLDTVSGVAAQTWSISGATPGSLASTDPDLAVAPSGQETVSFNMASGTVTQQVRRSRAVVSRVATVRAPVGNVHANPGAPPSCNYTQYSAGPYIYHNPEKFAGVWTDAGGPATMSETSSSSHTLGIGLNIDNKGWGADATATIETENSTTSSIGYQHSYYLYNEVNYRHYTRSCQQYTGGPQVHYDKARPHGFYSLQTPSLKVGINPMTWTECRTYTVGSVGKNHGASQEYGLGVSLPFVSLSAHARYSNSTETDFTFTGVPELLCGNTSAGWASAPLAGDRQKSSTCGGTRQRGSKRASDIRLDC